MRPKTSDGGEDNALEGDGEVVSVVEWKSSKIGGDARSEFRVYRSEDAAIHR